MNTYSVVKSFSGGGGEGPTQVNEAQQDAVDLLLEIGLPTELDYKQPNNHRQCVRKLCHLKRRLAKFNAHTGQWKR